MEKIKISRADNKQTFDGLVYCAKARGKFDDRFENALTLLKVQGDSSIATDGHRVHTAKTLDIPDGLYTYEKKGNAITLTPGNECKYPELDMIPKTFVHTVKVDRKELIHRMKLAKIINNVRYVTTELNFNAKLEIRTSAPDLGTLETTLETQGTVKPSLKINLNTKYILDALTSFKDKVIEIGLQSGSDFPVMFIGVNQTALIMPCRF